MIKEFFFDKGIVFFDEGIFIEYEGKFNELFRLPPPPHSYNKYCL